MNEIIDNPLPITSDGLSKGKELYNIYCGICHGEGADGNGYLVREVGGVYPAQPILYLLNGVAQVNLKKPKAAIEVLEMGLDYIIDDIQMEADFYKQLSLAHKLDNNIEQSQAFDKKAREVLNNND